MVQVLSSTAARRRDRFDVAGLDRVLLAVVAAGRAELTDGRFPRLLVDGRGVCDQFAAYRLLAKGLISASPRGHGGLARAWLTPAGRAALPGAGQPGGQPEGTER